MFGLSFQLGYTFITILHTLSVLTQYALNAASIVIQHKTFKQDQAFKHWANDGN